MENKDKKMEEVKKNVSKCIKDLFRFDKLFFTDFLFFIHIAAQVVVAIIYLMRAFMTTDILKILGAIVLYPIVFFAIRLAFELLSVQFSINKNLLEIKEHMKK